MAMARTPAAPLCELLAKLGAAATQNPCRRNRQTTTLATMAPAEDRGLVHEFIIGPRAAIRYSFLARLIIHGDQFA
ncbi:MAG: hypothetical protein CTY36_02100 [Methylocystis sp.]|nr:MAG: hypothetical protein CTY36_02100 [Methylocystis sp.]